MHYHATRLSLAIAAFAMCGLTAPLATAQVVHPWERLGANIVGAYSFPTILFHAGAVATTGHAIGWTVGGEFRQTYDARKTKTLAKPKRAWVRAGLSVEPLGLQVHGVL